ncbi:ABC transporter substrate-binding protein [Paraliobacillus sp. JSM ZJ581]|uniref:ABC transporter substrate-binding protein n=1 Tax=Paraliobacillus sp. JSM ZJ581 TaxID=3342118 RepID=UPI0035A84E1D
MKKLLTLFTIFTLVVILAACGDDDAKNASDSSDDANTSEEQVTVTIASWGFGTEEEKNLNRMMIDAFNEAHPNINAEIDESIDPADWNGSLSAAASASEMPDVFILAQIPTGLANDWLLDLNTMTEADEDFSNVPEAVQEAVKNDGKVYALPAGQHFLGYFVNKDLFEQANLNAPEMGMSIETFTSSVREVTDINNGVAGLNHPYTIPDWYPAAANSDLGWFTYQDGKFQLDSDEFISGVNLANTMLTNDYAYEALAEDQQANFTGEDPEQVWLNGGVGIKWDGTWITGHLESQSDFEWDFIGIPGDRVVMTHDYYGVSSSTEHPEAAYELAKWMSYGPEGFLKQMEIADAEEELNLGSMPVTTDQEVLDSYFERVDAPGIISAYENLDDAIIEPVKTVPGFAQSRWEAPTGIEVGEDPNVNIAGLVDAGMRGEINIEDYVSQINELANQKYKEGLEAINQ